MNEDAQLKAMAAELTAAGYKVRTDVRGETLEVGDVAPPGMDGITLDLVAELASPDEFDAERPRLLVIEVANRRRHVPSRSPKGRSLPRYVEDDEAVRRFKSISAGLAEVPGAELQIRFLDVSADQAAARQLKGPVRTKEAMFKRITEDRGLLVRSAGRDDLSRALVVTRLWSHWLRIVGHLHPGRERRELKNADLRTIQKDLFDQQLISLPPGRYRTIHQSLLGAFEGGDFETQDLISLEAEVRRLLDWAAERYGVPNPEAEPKPGSLFDRISRQIVERAVGQRREELEVAVTFLWFMQGTDAFPRFVADFLLATGREPIISDDLITELLEQAANSAS
jgi:hypothetical protein